MFNFYLLPNPGLLQLSGEHCLDFLQRQSSNDVQSLPPGSALVTVLTAPNARILDVLTAFPVGDALLALCLYPQATDRFLNSRIFFMDRVRVADLSAEFSQVEIFGPQADAALTGLGYPALSVGRASHSMKSHLVALDGIGGTAYRLIVETAAFPQILTALAASGGVALTPEAYHIQRVEAGLPAAGSELTDAYTPLEVNLRAAISTTKGCYTGQEVIARQLTYDKVTRHLVGLKLQAAAPPGTTVLADGKPVGAITSFAESPRLGPIALAVLRRPAHEPGVPVSVENIPATVSALPF